MTRRAGKARGPGLRVLTEKKHTPRARERARKQPVVGGESRHHPAPGRGLALTISALARELDTSRETVRRVLDRGNVAPAGEETGKTPTYRLREVLACWLRAPESGFDPDRLPAGQRLAHFRAESEKLAHQQRAGLLCSALEVEQRIAGIFKTTTATLDAIPDALERDHGATSQMVAAVAAMLERLRVDLHQRIAGEANGNGD